jgi:sulfur-carrier protein adenylyltransferase/sulfurtransferase
MPEMTLSERRAQAIDQVAAFLQRECGAVRLLEDEVRKVPRPNVVAGWHVNVQPFLEPRVLTICLDIGFPFSNPQFLVESGAPFLKWPHVEPNGRLCLTRDIYPTDASQPDGIVRELLPVAFDLLRRLENGSLTEDFRSEFLSYWNRTIPENGLPIQSLLEPRGPSRIVYCGRVGGYFITAETEHEISRWLGNLFGKTRAELQFEKTCLLWLQKPLLPSGYPNRAQDVWKMGESVGAQSILSQLVKRDTSVVTA